MGGIYGCGCKEVYRFHHITYPYSSCFCSFLQQHPYFFCSFFLNVFRSCSSTFFVIASEAVVLLCSMARIFYILYIISGRPYVVP